MLFHKELFCEKCHAPINKKNMCIFDYSLQGRNKNGKKIMLCQSCCIEELIVNLQNHTQKAVIIQPSSKYNAYAFYGFKTLIEGSKHSFTKNTEIESTEAIKSFLPNDNEKCNFCSNPARYTWCTLDIFKDGKPFDMDMDLNEKKKSVYLCTNCLINILSDKIKTENINIKAIYPIVDDEVGYYTPWIY